MIPGRTVGLRPACLETQRVRRTHRHISAASGPGLLDRLGQAVRGLVPERSPRRTVPTPATAALPVSADPAVREAGWDVRPRKQRASFKFDALAAAQTLASMASSGTRALSHSAPSISRVSLHAALKVAKILALPLVFLAAMLAAAGALAFRVPFALIENWKAASLEPNDLTAEDRHQRLAWTGVVLASIAAVILVRVAMLQMGERDRWSTLASKQHETELKIQGARGSVLDAQERVLTVSVEAVSAGVHPRVVGRSPETIATLAKILQESPAEISTQLSSPKPFVWLARGLPSEAGTALEATGIKGLEVIREFRRDYPQGDLARVILGQVSLDGRGQSGIELQYDQELQAQSMTVPLRRDARGRRFGLALSANPGERFNASGTTPWFQAVNAAFAETPGDSPAATDPLPRFRDEGGPIQLTIDSIIQGIVEDEFQKGLNDAKAKRVFGLMMDADSGDILAMAQALPPSNGTKQSATEKLRNIPIQDAFEPGSSFKPIVAGIALERGLVSPQEIIDCEMGHYEFAGHIIRDTHPVGAVPFPEVLIRSSNIGMTKVGMRLGKEKLFHSISEFGFGKYPGVQLPGEGRGILKPLDKWAMIDVGTNSFGQGISVTALQIVRAYSAIANGGILITPRIVRHETSAAELDGFPRVLRKQTAEMLAEMLVGVTEDGEGTGKAAAIHGLPVSGKTGTAQKARADGRGYDPDNVIGSFIGFVDGSRLGVNRKLVMMVVVDEPGVRPRWGGIVAAPVFRRALERTLSYLMAHDAASSSAASI